MVNGNKINDLVYRESQNTTEWSIILDINALRDDIRELQVEVDFLNAENRKLWYWSNLSVVFAITATIFVMLTWGR